LNVRQEITRRYSGETAEAPAADAPAAAEPAATPLQERLKPGLKATVAGKVAGGKVSEETPAAAQTAAASAPKPVATNAGKPMPPATAPPKAGLRPPAPKVGQPAATAGAVRPGLAKPGEAAGKANLPLTAKAGEAPEKPAVAKAQIPRPVVPGAKATTRLAPPMPASLTMPAKRPLAAAANVQNVAKMPRVEAAPVVDNSFKGKLHQIAQKLVGKPLSKMDVTYKSQKTEDGFVATVTIPKYDADLAWEGLPAANPIGAENAAAEIALMGLEPLIETGGEETAS